MKRYVVHWASTIGKEYPTEYDNIMGRYWSRRRAERHANRCRRYMRTTDRVWVGENTGQ